MSLVRQVSKKLVAVYLSYAVHSDNSGSLINQRVPLANSRIKYFRNES